MFSWLRKRREWRKAHIEAFSPATETQADGLTLFQHEALGAISSLVREGDFKRVEMIDEDGAYLHASIVGSDIQLYIYPDGAQISGRDVDSRYEEWDYLTPSELLDAFAEECADRIKR